MDKQLAEVIAMAKRVKRLSSVCLSVDESCEGPACTGAMQEFLNFVIEMETKNEERMLR